MQLSKLEIKGFKSFGDKITIHFDKGVTGIVGPNGCGKSNVVDAIRWVLGEQKTRNLRSDKMENLIFNGTKSRKPLQMAEVSLTFLNDKSILPTEYSQVTISRRYYRTGESEYLLNGVGCRLKDINNLFLDTGIGPDSYAIIELKMVDDILSDRENSRRSLLEEAAGISKFKIRKRETFRKLEDTEADLNRLEDVLFEIRKNMKALEKQARQAEEYFQIKANYKEAAIRLAQIQLATKSEIINQLKQGLLSVQEERTAMGSQVALSEAQLEEIKLRLVQEEKTLSSRQKTLNEYANKIRDLENEKRLRQERRMFFSDRLKKLEAEKHDLAQKLDSLSIQTKTLLEGEEKEQNKLSERTALLSTEKGKVDELQQKLAQGKAFVESHILEVQVLQREVYDLEKSVELAETQKLDLENERNKVQSASEDQHLFLENFEKKLVSIADEMEKRDHQLVEAREWELKLEADIAEKAALADGFRERLAEMYRRLDARQNELNLTRALVENLEGFPEAVKFLRKNKSWSKKAPLVADILNIGEKYAIALEAVLEPFLNYYVVQTETEAFLAMKMLSEGKKGKANFLILDRLKNHKSGKQKEIKDALPAKKLVEYESQYENLVSYLLDNVYITDKAIPFATDSAETPVLFDELSWDWEESTVVSISGAMTRRPFSISGGSISVFEGNKIGKAVQLKKLETEIAEVNLLIHNEKVAEEQNRDDLTALRQSTKKSLIDHLQKELIQLNQEKATLETRMEQSLELLRSSAEKKEVLSTKIIQLEELISEKRPELIEKKDLLQNQSVGLQEKQKEVKMWESELFQQNQLVKSLELECVSLQNQLARKKQEAEFRQAEKDQLEIRQQGAEKEWQSVQNELSQLSENSDSGNADLPGLYEEKETIAQGLSEVERSYFELRNNQEIIEKEIKEVSRKREHLLEKQGQLQEEMAQHQAQATAIQERIQIEFEEWIDEGQEGNNIQTSEEEMWKNKAQTIKNQLDRMGPINLMAREAYQEIKERNDFIEAQKNDLLEARASLVNTISEIETVARTSFLKTFGEVQENFKMVFRSLFTSEDTCDLVLSDPQNPLDSPIDIMARPKGKRPLTINQLSGGEKTLTAISLLFAIYLIKPAPFCIFDEADAPLDDTNIDKFNNIIRTFSDRSQFIIVTHNKRTMASTDVIYGVTMPEQGVSRVIPVDLRALA